MGGPRKATRTAKGYALVVVAACAVLGVTVSHPWVTINGSTYTFLDADGWKALPIAELVVCIGGGLAALVAVRHVRRIGLAIGCSALGLNLLGGVVAARLANVHNSDQYFRLSAIMTMRPAWAGWTALGASVALIVSGASRWRAVTSRRGGARFEEHVDFEAGAGQHAFIPVGERYFDDDIAPHPVGLPTLDDVLAPPTRSRR